jgi:hypothetical protein
VKNYVKKFKKMKRELEESTAAENAESEEKILPTEDGANEDDQAPTKKQRVEGDESGEDYVKKEEEGNNEDEGDGVEKEAEKDGGDEDKKEEGEKEGSNQQEGETSAAGEIAAGPNNTSRSAAGRRLTFPEKLMEVLSNEECKGAIAWLPNGNAFSIHPGLFMKDVLAKHFDGTKFESFTRKLNRWGFKRIAGEDSPDETFAYSHHLFKRDFPELCRGMSGGKKMEQDFSHLIRYRERERMLSAAAVNPAVFGGQLGFVGMNPAMGFPAGFNQQEQFQNLLLQRQLAAAGGMGANPYGNFPGTGGWERELALRQMFLQQQQFAAQLGGAQMGPGVAPGSQVASVPGGTPGAVPGASIPDTGTMASTITGSTGMPAPAATETAPPAATAGQQVDNPTKENQDQQQMQLQIQQQLQQQQQQMQQMQQMQQQAMLQQMQQQMAMQQGVTAPATSSSNGRPFGV